MLVISIQSSSLWVRLLTVPARGILVIRLSIDKSSGLIILIFIIIFIGGLLILLVRVASAVYQEQALSPRGLVLGITLVAFSFLIMNLKVYDWSQVKTTIFFWTSALKTNFLIFRVTLVLISLIIISFLLMEFKGIIRKL